MPQCGWILLLHDPSMERNVWSVVPHLLSPFPFPSMTLLQMLSSAPDWASSEVPTSENTGRACVPWAGESAKLGKVGGFISQIYGNMLRHCKQVDSLSLDNKSWNTHVCANSVAASTKRLDLLPCCLVVGEATLCKRLRFEYAFIRHLRSRCKNHLKHPQ